LISIPRLNAALRQLTTIGGYISAFSAEPSLDWSPDGKWLLTMDRKSTVSASSLVLIDAAAGQKTFLTQAPPHTSDSDAKFSPDGEMVAFRRSVGSLSDDIYVIPASGARERRLTFQTPAVDGLAWSPDGGSLIVSSGRHQHRKSLVRVFEWQESCSTHHAFGAYFHACRISGGQTIGVCHSH